MEKIISIIIPCYNAAPFISRCIESLVNQTIGLENLELIFVNDASTDDTSEVLASYEKQYPNNILVINLEENVRQGGARNIGLMYASCDYIGYVDADDWVEPTMYERLFEKMTTYDCDIVRCRLSRDKEFFYFDKPAYSEKEDVCIEINSDDERSDLIASCYIGRTIVCCLYKKSLLIDNRVYFLENVAYEDIFFFALLYLYVKRIYFLEEALYHYYINPSSTVTSVNAAYHADYLDVMCITWEELSSRGALNKYPLAEQFDHMLSTFVGGMKLLSNRYDPFPYDYFLDLQDHLRRTNCINLENPYIKKHCNAFQKMLLSLMGQKVGKEEIQKIAALIKEQNLL